MFYLGLDSAACANSMLMKFTNTLASGPHTISIIIRASQDL
jgi:hypothetical protein